MGIILKFTFAIPSDEKAFFASLTPVLQKIKLYIADIQ